MGFFVIYFVSVFGFSQAEANGLGNWFWSADAVAVVGVGIISDKLRVRKPFMLAGGIVAVAMGLVFAGLATRPHTTYTTFVVVIMVMSAARGVAYAPWMAAYTETLESRNPALVATGLAIWGWVLRIVAATAFLVVPFVVPSATPVADYGPQAAALQARYSTQIATLKVDRPATLAELQADPSNRRAEVAAIGQIRPPVACPLPSQRPISSPRRSIPKADREFLVHARTRRAGRPGRRPEGVAAVVDGLRRRRAPLHPHDLPPGGPLASLVGTAGPRRSTTPRRGGVRGTLILRPVHRRSAGLRPGVRRRVDVPVPGPGR